MQNRTALIVALVSGGLAVAIVAVDLQFGLHVELQEKTVDGWTAVETDRYEPFGGCSGPELRLVVNNDWIWGTDVDVSVWYWDAGGAGQVTVLDDTWHLGAGGVQDHAFTIPDSAFQYDDGTGEIRKSTVSVEVHVDGEYFGTCVQGPDVMVQTMEAML